MNVENRKLFANRDARKRLAEMGGILASSPELMGEAMKFANGGQAQEQEFIINIPGLTSPGEMLRIKESTLMQLGDMFPDLMGQQNALVQPVELMGAEAMNARPGDAVIGARISRMMQQSAPEEVVLESAPITSGRERAISGEGALDQFAAPRSSASTPSDMSLMDRIQKLDRDIGSSIQAADRAVQGKIVEVLGDVYQIIADDIRGDIDRIKIIRASTGTEVTDPAIKQAVLSNQRIAGEDMAMAQDVPQGQPRVFAQPEVMSPESEPEVMFPGELSRAFVPEPRGAEELMAGSIYPAEERSFNGPEQKLLNAMNPAFDSFGGDLLAKDVRGAKDLMAGPIYPAEERSSDTSTNLASLSDYRLEAERLSRKSIVPNFVQDVIDNLQTVPGTVGAGAADVVGSTLAALGATDAGAKFLESAKNKRDLIATIYAAEKERESETVADVAEVVAEQKRRDPTGPMSEIDDGTGTDFSLVPKEAIVKAVETNDPKAASAALMKSITGVDVHGGTTPPPSDDTPDAPKPDAPKTRKQRMLETVEMISELFGIREKDKAEDMYDLMATIGFAMASGESPNAMKNIADAFLVGAQMKRADKKEDKKLDQAIKTLAVKDVLEQESDERALKRLLAKEERAKTQALEIYVQKLEAAEEFEDPKSIFANEPYKSMAIIARQDPPNTDPDQTVIERLTAGGFNPAAINKFIKAMQLSTEAGAGAGVTPGQVQNLDQIPDGT
jgi:hypothetical protein